MIGITVNDTTLGTTVANLGMTDVRFPKPVFHGDTLRVQTKVVSLRESKSRPDAGIVEFFHTALNQRGEIVAQARARRDAQGPKETLMPDTDQHAMRSFRSCPPI